MRFMGHYRADQVSPARLPTGSQLLEKMGRYMQESSALDGQLGRDVVPLNSPGACVKLSHGQVSVTGCRYTEIKSTDAPCAMFEVESIAEAIQWTVSFLKVVGGGECEIRPLDSAADCVAS